MKTSQRTFITAAVLLLGLGTAKSSFAITGCTNQNFMGTYNAQVTSVGFTNDIFSVNAASSSSTGSGGTTGTTSSTPPKSSTGIVLPAGFGSTTASIAGNTPALSRFYFDGSGNVMGVTSSTSIGLSPAGTYSVASNCTATITLSSGQHYDAVLVNQGTGALFIQTDAGANGATGSLQRSSNSCVAPLYPTSLGFSFFGATAVAPAATTGGSGTTGTTPALPTLTPFSAIGTLNMDGAGNFTITEYQVNSSSAAQTLNGSGTYSVNSNCSLSLSFATPPAGATGVLTAPASLSVLLGISPTGAYTGLISVQPVAGTVFSGAIVSQ